jgi:hypothetical protein
MLSATKLDAERPRNQPAVGVFHYQSLSVTTKEPIMAFSPRFLPTAVVVAGLAIAPGAHAEYWHGHGHPHGNNAGAAIVGGLVGLGVGAAIGSGGYYAPPPVYYGPPPGYYAPPPPAVYYGYGY